jgi:DNA-binding NarL/FixJ family response regulator
MARSVSTSESGNGKTDGATRRPITVLIVDDERTFGEALEVALEREKDLHVVQVATDGREAVALAGEHRPDVVLMDDSMPGMSGIEATRRIIQVDPQATVVILSGTEEEHMLARAVQAGAAGVVSKTEGVRDVALTVRRVHRGEAIHDQGEVEFAQRRLRHRRGQEDDIRERLDRLTPREIEILTAMASGRTPEEIATVLGMSPNTLRTHSQNILTKLRVHSRMEALVLAIRHGKVGTVDLTNKG